VRLERLFGVAACVLVALGLVLAFLIIGPPSHARLVSFDQQRVRDLENIASRMHERFGDATGGLPKQLPSDLEAKDPATRIPYEYQKLDGKNYELCTRFSLAAESEDSESWYGRSWPPHRAGRTCYEFNVTASDVAPRAIRQ